MRRLLPIFLALSGLVYGQGFSSTNARRIQGLQVKSGLSCAADGYALLWVAANSQFECLPVGGGGTGILSLNSQIGDTQTFTNDTNVTIVSGSDTHVITWVGTLAKARQNAATVYNDAANTWSTGAQSMAAATSFITPVGAGAAPTANGSVAYDSTANRYKFGHNGTSRTISYTLTSGAKALATSAIASGACTVAQTDTATGALTTDTVEATFNADPTGVTGYAPSASGGLFVYVYPTADTVNFKVCNNTSGSITPGAVTLNWKISR